MLWTHSNVVVPPFRGETEVDLPAECTFDLTIASAKYFDALEGGEAPLLLLFSGTVFYEGGDGRIQIAQIPWTKETAYRLPVSAWKNMIDKPTSVASPTAMRSIPFPLRGGAVKQWTAIGHYREQSRLGPSVPQERRLRTKFIPALRHFVLSCCDTAVSE